MRISGLLVSAACVLAAGTASAQEITLRLADSLPVEHVITRAVGKPFMDRVTELTDGKVVFEHYPAEQLGKARDILSAVQTGLADIGYVIPNYVSEKMPRSAVAELPGGYPSACVGTKALNVLAEPGGMLNELEYAPNDTRVLLSVVLPPYQAAFSGRATVDKIADISGLKVRSNPGPMELSIQSIGGIPVRMTPPEIFDSLSKGTIDGLLLPHTSIVSYGLDEVVETVTKGANFGSVVITYSMAENRWQQLPEDVQQALLQAGKEAALSGCKQFDQEEARLAAEFEERGIKVLDFDSLEGSDELRAKFAQLGDEWAQILEERGVQNARAVLEEFRKQVEIAERSESAAN